MRGVQNIVQIVAHEADAKAVCIYCREGWDHADERPYCTATPIWERIKKLREGE